MINITAETLRFYSPCTRCLCGEIEVEMKKISSFSPRRRGLKHLHELSLRRILLSERCNEGEETKRKEDLILFAKETSYSFSDEYTYDEREKVVVNT